MYVLFFGVVIHFSCSNESNLSIEEVHLDQSDSARNAYTVIIPGKEPFKAVLYLLPGLGETAEYVMQQTSLPLIAAENGFLTIIPTLQDGVLSMGVDSVGQQCLKLLMQDVNERFLLTNPEYVIGGFSIGGSIAIKYAGNSKDKPAAVFGIDPPLDFERYYFAATRNLRISNNDAAKQENLFMIEQLEKLTGGSPENYHSEYLKLSPFAHNDTTQHKIHSLIHVPLRLYSEPDIEWWMSERGLDYYSLNGLDCAALVNELNLLEAEQAKLIISTNKGYREPGHKRHPHSWSIADADDLVQWLNASLIRK
ncbi:MAG: alpha/beta hydrolase [Bacteroidia bacterium]